MKQGGFVDNSFLKLGLMPNGCLTSHGFLPRVCDRGSRLKKMGSNRLAIMRGCTCNLPENYLQVN